MINNSDESEDDFPISPPKFINRKKRMHLDAIGSRIVTPIMQQDSHMSICNTTNTSHNSSLKLSFPQTIRLHVHHNQKKETQV